MRRRKVRFTFEVIAGIVTRRALVDPRFARRRDHDRSRHGGYARPQDEWIVRWVSFELLAVWDGKRWTREHEEALVAHARLLMASGAEHRFARFTAAVVDNVSTGIAGVMSSLEALRDLAIEYAAGSGQRIPSS